MKRFIHFYLVVVLLITITFTSCAQNKNSEYKSEKVELSSYWDGKAEISVYTLSQNRYNTIHPGQIVSVWVKEDFLTKKQVKNDYYKDENSTPILKNIQVRKFTTGVYDYSMLSSVFTPLDRKTYPHSLKVSGSSQEWCGHGYVQLNLEGNKYKVTEHSYFENIADRELKTKKEAFLEDELFNIVRMDPDQLPVGDVMIVPSVNFIQLRHVKPVPYHVKAELQNYKGGEFSELGDGLKAYSLEFKELNRTIEVVFENDDNHKIVGWIDAYPSAFDGKVRSTIVKLSSMKNLKYWNLNSLNDVELRKELGLLY